MNFIKHNIFIGYFSLLLILLFSSCSEKPKMINDKDLKSIIYEIAFSDIIVANLKREINKDTTHFTEPILKKHGYNIDDFNYTIEKLISRKSNVLPTIISEITEDVKELKSQYNYKAEILSKLDERADSLFSKNLYLDSLKINHKDSIHKAEVKLNLDNSGILKIKSVYKIDSTDKNKNYLLTLTLKDTITGKTASSSIKWLNKYIRKGSTRNTENIEYSFDAKKYNQAIVNFYNIEKYLKDDKIKTPNVVFDTLSISFHYPQLTSREMLLDSMLNKNIFINKIKVTHEKKDSSPLSVYIK